jgi:hypothetical protein
MGCQRLRPFDFGSPALRQNSATPSTKPRMNGRLLMTTCPDASCLSFSAFQRAVFSAETQVVDDGDLTRALAAFGPVWEQLSLREQMRVVQLLIERVEYDGRTGDVAITFHPAGIKTLNAEVEQETVAC